MPFYEVAPGVAVLVIPKVASMSLSSAIDSFNGKELTTAEAMTYARRVLFLRDPVERLKSVFNHFYTAIGKCSSDMLHVLRPGIITADGYRLRGGADRNPHHFTPELEVAYLSRVAAKRAGRRISDEDLSRELDADDWKRLVNHVLSANRDNHWNSQIGQATFNGTLFANEIVMFEDIQTWWTANVTQGELPHVNRWLPVPKPEYKTSELDSLFLVDFERRVEIIIATGKS